MPKASKLSFLSDEQIIALWKSSRRAEDICDEYECSKETLRKYYLIAQGKGLIPYQRKTYKRRHTRNQVEIDDKPEKEDGKNGAPRIAILDPLLKRLYEVHKEPRYDIPEHLQCDARW